MIFQKNRQATLLMITLIGLCLAACGRGEAPPGEAIPKADPMPPPSRGLFAAGSCASSERVAVPDNAAFAVYFDSAGEEIETANAEVLAGTQDKLMCGATPKTQGPDPGSCSPKCPLTLGRKTYCVPPPCP